MTPTDVVHALQPHNKVLLDRNCLAPSGIAAADADIRTIREGDLIIHAVAALMLETADGILKNKETLREVQEQIQELQLEEEMTVLDMDITTEESRRDLMARRRVLDHKKKFAEEAIDRLTMLLSSMEQQLPQATTPDAQDTLHALYSDYIGAYMAWANAARKELDARAELATALEHGAANSNN